MPLPSKTMKIKILDSIAGHGNPKLGIPEFSYGPGQIVTVKHSLAVALIKRGAAIAAESEPIHTAPVSIPETVADPVPTVDATLETLAKAAAENLYVSDAVLPRSKRK